MRWILTLLALAIGAWYLGDRRRRARLQATWPDDIPPSVKTQQEFTAATLREQARPDQVSVVDAPGTAGQAVQDAADAATKTSEKAAGTDTGTDTAREAGSSAASPAGKAPATKAGDAERVPEGQRPRPVAGEGTTAAGGAVNPLSPASAGPTAADTAESLPEGLTSGERGTGGPATSTQAPSAPGSAATSTTGMEQPPEIDREGVLERTGGNFIGNKNTRVFHAAGDANLPAEENRVYFETEQEALDAGFRPSTRG